MFTTGSSDAHQAAMQGDVNKLKAIAESDPSQLHAVDSNGWKVRFFFPVASAYE